MAKLVYAQAGFEIESDDRSLAHLQIVLGCRLRRRDSFFFSWINDVSCGSGRASIWLDHTIPLYFVFDACGRHDINRDWIDQLNSSAGTLGVMFTPEPPGPGVGITHLLRSHV